MKILGFDITRQKSKIPVMVNEETLYQMLFETMAPMLKLERDNKLIDTVTDGYAASTDVFSIVNRASLMFSQIPYKVFKGKTELEQGTLGPLETFFEDSPTDYTFTEFRQVWEAMGMVTGDSIVFYLLRSGTGDSLLQFQLAPSQHVEIEYGDFLNPIKGYTLDLTSKDKLIPPENMWHVRQFPNLDFRQGKNYRGLSPVRVAAKVINSQLFSQDLVESSYKRGMPPGILYKEDATAMGGQPAIEEQRKSMEAAWDKKYGTRSNRKNAGRPVFTMGKLGWLPLGFTSFTDLQLVEINKLALKSLCNVWGIPSRVMNDTDGGSYSKDKEDRKAIYTNRLIPDNRLFWDGINRILKSTGYRYEPDYSQIPELQEDRKDMATIFKIGYDSNAVQPNEIRALLNLEPDPQLDGLYRGDLEMNQMNQNPLPPDKL